MEVYEGMKLHCGSVYTDFVKVRGRHFISNLSDIISDKILIHLLTAYRDRRAMELGHMEIELVAGEVQYAQLRVVVEGVGGDVVEVVHREVENREIGQVLKGVQADLVDRVHREI